MFERTLESLIKGLRSNRGADEAAFVTTLQEEIRLELRSGDMDVKAGAVLKLTYVSCIRHHSRQKQSSLPMIHLSPATNARVSSILTRLFPHSRSHGQSSLSPQASRIPRSNAYLYT